MHTWNRGHPRASPGTPEQCSSRQQICKASFHCSIQSCWIIAVLLCFRLSLPQAVLKWRRLRLPPLRKQSSEKRRKSLGEKRQGCKPSCNWSRMREQQCWRHFDGRLTPKKCMFRPRPLKTTSGTLTQITYWRN